MKNSICLLLCLVFCVTANFTNAQEKPTIEEEVLMRTFGSYQAALVFDEKCNDVAPKDRFDLSNAKNVNLIGHEQMLAARIGGVQHARFPDAEVDVLVKRLVKAKKIIKDSAYKTLNEKGCESAEAQASKKTLEMFIKAHPSQIFTLANKEIIKRGGTVTSVEEIEGKK